MFAPSPYLIENTKTPAFDYMLPASQRPTRLDSHHRRTQSSSTSLSPAPTAITSIDIEYQHTKPPAYAAQPLLMANPKIDITLQGLDDELLTMQARLRPGARTRNVERAIRRYMGSDIQDDDTVQIYRDGEILRADDRLGNDSQLLHYRVSRATNAEHSSPTQV
ncbi:hypothetical protein IMZ48_26410, partial [Candidatus Bathyarchaeota archaeon]|nr:hypothetical protein [Candidatus Bathyarchaeota archaeon]